MRKWIQILVVLVMIIGSVGCRHSKTLDNEKEENNMNNMENKNSIVLYFSATGTTKKVAEMIQTVTNSNIIEILPQEEYTEEDLNYNEDTCRANQEQKNPLARPMIKNQLSLDSYETIYIGYPIWWGTNPKIIFTLLDQYSLTGKKIVLFATSGGSDIAQSISDLKSYQPNLTIVGGKRFSSNVSLEEVKNWIESLTLTSKATTIYAKIGSHVLPIVLEENSSSQAFVTKLREKDVTVSMSDYGNFEKVGSLGFTLPTNDESITTEVGDVILYQGNSITIYYDTNHWNFTKLGKIPNITQKELLEILGKEEVTVTFTLHSS